MLQRGGGVPWLVAVLGLVAGAGGAGLVAGPDPDGAGAGAWLGLSRAGVFGVLGLGMTSGLCLGTASGSTRGPF